MWFGPRFHAAVAVLSVRNRVSRYDCSPSTPPAALNTGLCTTTSSTP